MRSDSEDKFIVFLVVLGLCSLFLIRLSMCYTDENYCSCHNRYGVPQECENGDKTALYDSGVATEYSGFGVKTWTPAGVMP